LMATSIARPTRLLNSPFPAPDPPSDVWIYDVHNSTFDEKVLLQTLSGLVAQRAPQVCLIDSSQDWSIRHANLLPSSVSKHTEYLNDLPGLLKQFWVDIQGYILCDSTGANLTSMHIGVSLSGVLKGVVATHTTMELLRSVGLSQLVDARSLNQHDVFQMYQSNFSYRILFNQKLEALWSTTDYAVYTRAWTMYDPALTSMLAQRALTRMDNMSVVMGWADEVHFVGSASQHGHFVLCSDLNSYNLPLYSSFSYVPPRSDSLVIGASAIKLSSGSVFSTSTGSGVSGGSGRGDASRASLPLPSPTLSRTIGNRKCPVPDSGPGARQHHLGPGG
jgi:hypothetical protein